MKLIASCIISAFILTGCMASRFAVRGENIYWLQKPSNACAIGTEAGIADDLWMEATRFCSARKEVPEKISSAFVFGIPYFRCATLEIEFRCIPEAMTSAFNKSPHQVPDHGN